MKLQYKVGAVNINSNGIGIIRFDPDFKEHEGFHRAPVVPIAFNQVKPAALQGFKVGDVVNISIEKI